jgi:hypothetical protein
MNKKPMSNTKAAIQIIGGLFFAPIAPLFLVADVVRNALRQGSYPPEEQDRVMGECDITDYIERKLFGE